MVREELTAGEGQKKVAQRRSRHMLRKKLRRREVFLREITREVPPEIFLPEEALRLLLDDLRRVRNIVKSAKRRDLFHQLEAHFASGENNAKRGLPPPPRPTAVLSRLNKSTVYPPLVSPKIINCDTLRIDELLKLICRARAAKAAPHELLDFLATASGMSWQTCAELLLARKIIVQPIDPTDIEATSSARRFWATYTEGGTRYKVLVQAKEIPLWQGDWAFFDRLQFTVLLPGIIVPDHFEREEYVVNYIDTGEYFSLDVHSMPRGKPLFQHRFLPQFSPLIFGKPPITIGRNRSALALPVFD